MSPLMTNFTCLYPSCCLLQSGVEEALDKAVEEGDFERAVDLSSQLAGREVPPHTTCMHTSHTCNRNSVRDGSSLGRKGSLKSQMNGK